MTKKEQFLSILETCKTKINAIEIDGYTLTEYTLGEILSEVYLSNPIFFKENAELVINYINKNFKFRSDEEYKKLLDEREKYIK